jgi:hypothetical protein
MSKAKPPRLSLDGVALHAPLTDEVFEASEIAADNWPLQAPTGPRR